MTEPLTTTEVRYLVSAYMTKEEILERQEREGLAGLVQLAYYTKYGGQRYLETHIANIIKDAAVELEIEGAEKWDSVEFFPELLPFDLKVWIMERAIRTWDPGDEANVVSSWVGSREDAQRFFADCPELLDFRTKSAEEIGAAWQSHRFPIQEAGDGK